MRAPTLDDRAAEQIREELVRRIPMHAPGWTERDPADPGIALIELFAHLASGLLGRMGELPRDCEGELLRLIDVAPLPARPAAAMLCFELPKGQPDPVILPCDPVTPRVVAAAGSRRFEVVDELCVLPVTALTAIKARTSLGEEDLDGDSMDELAGHLHAHDLTAASAEGGAPEYPVDLYETAALPEVIPGALPDPLWLSDAVDGALWIGLLAPAEEAASSASMDQARRRLAGQILSLGVVVDGGWRGHEHDADSEVRRIPAAVDWAISTGRGADPGAPSIEGLIYAPLQVVSDGTRGLLRSGVLRIQLPLKYSDIGVFPTPEGLAGAGELPPALDDEAQEARLLCWLRATLPVARPVGLRLVAANAVDSSARITLPPEVLGQGTGQPGLRLSLSAGDVEPGSVQLEGYLPDLGWRAWSPLETLASACGDDRAFTLEPASGTLSFGDGVHGAMPALGELLRVRGYRAGGGAAGNVPAGAISRVQSGAPLLKVRNPMPARGGRDAETPEEARRRAPSALRHKDRAVSAEDFRDLALQTPGVQLGRVEVLPRTRPPEWLPGLPGVVTLVVVPASDPDQPDEPRPDQEALRAVAEWLEPRRLVTTELCVTAPEYVPVSISIAIEVKAGFGFAGVRRWVELGLRQHFAPLPPYGPAGGGWPFDRDVRLEDVHAAALQVEGVRLVRDVAIVGRPRPGDPVSLRSGSGGPHAVTLLPWQLVSVREVLVAEGGSAPAPGPLDGPALPAPARPRLPIRVPVARERC